MCPSRGLPRLFNFNSKHPLLLVILAACSASAAPSNADLIQYLGGKATGQSLKTPAYTLTLLANDEKVLVSYSYDGAMKKVGWMAMGCGTAMTDA